MAIYRPPKARWPLVAAASLGGLLLGFILGFVLGSDEPDPVEAARTIRSTLTAAAGSLEVAGIEYREAVSAGAVERPAEYEGSLRALESSRSGFRTVRPALDELDPARVRTIEGLYARCAGLMDERAATAGVTDCLADLQRQLEGNRV